MNTLTTGGRRRINLGQLDPACTASYHGTYAAYTKAKCSCPHAREAHRIYNKRQREGRLNPALLDATGTRRRVQGMWALGHPSTVIIDACDGQFDRPQIVRFCQQQWITPVHRESIAVAYRHLSVRPGTSTRTRNRALAAGYALPVQWAGDIDDPATEPEPLALTGPLESVGDVIDEVAVERALAGERVDLTDAELVVVLQAGTARGEPLSRLSNRLGVNYWGARKMLGGDLPPRREVRARVEAEILRSRADDYVIAVHLGVHRSTVSRARARLIESGALAAAS